MIVREVTPEEYEQAKRDARNLGFGADPRDDTNDYHGHVVLGGKFIVPTWMAEVLAKIAKRSEEAP